MDSFLFCFALVAVIALGGREQMVVAQLSDALADRSGALERRPVPLLALGIASACLTAAIMTYAGLTMTDILPPRAARMLIAFALAIAAFELTWPVRLRPVTEPTRSGMAVALVLFWRQVGDAARFVIFAFAAGATYPLTALLGGAAGGVVAVIIGWWAGHEQLSKLPLRWIRIALAVGMIVAALFIGLNARYAVH
jgi:putative Ca2+/H+ antiporter (TMEM165/GDT1 family)